MSKSLLPVLAVALFLSFFRLGSATFFDVDEAVFAEATKEMVQSGDFVTPTYNGENRYDKPILFYWLMAAAYKIFGINEFSARLPSALSALLLAVAVFLFARRYSGGDRPFYAAITLTISPYFLLYSHAAVTDMALTLMITLSLLSFYISLFPDSGNAAGKRLSPGKPNKYIYGFYAFSALAFLTKGLIGIVFPFGIAVVFLLIVEGLRGIKRLFHLKGIILFLVISAPWYTAQLAINGHEFIEQFVIKHHFKRYTGVISGHKGVIYYYLPALIVGLLPWIAFLPGGIRKVFADRKKYQGGGGAFTDDRGAPWLDLFAFVWFAFIFMFFSLSTTKLPNYILPAVPAAAILISAGMLREQKWLRYENISMTLALLLTGIALLYSVRFLSRLGISDTAWILPTAVVLFAMSLAACYSALTGKTCYSVLASLALIFLVMLSVKATPLANDFLQGTLHRYSLYAKKILRPDERIIAFDINNPSIVFYSDHRVARVGNEAELMPLLTQIKRALIISKAKEIGMLKGLGLTLLETDGRYAIFEKR